MTAQNHYETLGVAKSATPDEIKTAYRKLARKYHPDVTVERDGPDRIKVINEAYQILGDVNKRRVYDHGKLNGGSFVNRGGEGRVDFGDMGVLFEQLFRDGLGASSRRRGQLTLTLEQVFAGGGHALSIDGRDITIKLQRGTVEGQVVQINIAGQDPLLLDIKYAPHTVFSVRGHDVVCTLTVPVWKAAIGGGFTVRTLGGDVDTILPAGLTGGQKLRLRGRGMPHHGGTGDQFCIVQIQATQPTTKAQKAAYAALAKAFDTK